LAFLSCPSSLPCDEPALVILKVVNQIKEIPHGESGTEKRGFA
jgi:hypothetical protein